MMARHPIIAILMLLLASASALAACPAAPDGFKGYGKANFPAGEGRVASADGLNLNVPGNAFATWISDTPVIDSWICMSFWFPDAKADSQIGGGVVFWKLDAQNFYLALVRRGGSFGIYRHAADGWTSVKSGGMSSYYVNAPQGPIVRTGPATHMPESYNQIEVVSLGDYVRVFINDRMVMEMKRQPPGQASSAGIYAEADADKDYLWLIESVSITELCRSC